MILLVRYRCGIMFLVTLMPPNKTYYRKFTSLKTVKKTTLLLSGLGLTKFIGFSDVAKNHCRQPKNFRKSSFMVRVRLALE